MIATNLTVSPASYQFLSHELAELRRILAEIDKYTLVMPVSGPHDFTLNEKGKNSEGYGYTDGSLIQLCSLVAPGLAQLVMDLSGQWRRPKEDLRIYSSRGAIDILNQLIRLRFDFKLMGLQVIRNTRQKTIDGIVGSQYRYLANSDYLNRVDKECTACKGKFLEACLYGRQMVARYVGPEDQVPYKIANDDYAFGYHFANSEIGGKSVRASSILVRSKTGDCVLCPFTSGTGGRVVHCGRDFERRMHALMVQITQQLPLRTTVEAGGDWLAQHSLGLGVENRDKRVRQLEQLLTRRDLTQAFAKRVVSSAASKGASNEDALADALPSSQRQVLESRTGYDLFAALSREARQLPIDQREVAEQLAYMLLIGKISY